MAALEVCLNHLLRLFFFIDLLFNLCKKRLIAYILQIIRTYVEVFFRDFKLFGRNHVVISRTSCFSEDKIRLLFVRKIKMCRGDSRLFELLTNFRIGVISVNKIVVYIRLTSKKFSKTLLVLGFKTFDKLTIRLMNELILTPTSSNSVLHFELNVISDFLTSVFSG